MRIFLRGNTYHVHVEYGGKSVRQSLRTSDKREATVRAKSIERSLIDGSYQTSVAGSMGIVKSKTLQEAFDYIHATHWSKLKDTTGPTYRFNVLKRYIPGDTQLSQVTRGMVNDMILALTKLEHHRGKGYTPASINRILTTLTYILSWGVDSGYIDKAPKVPLFKESQNTRVCAQDEQDAIWKTLALSIDPVHKESLLLFELLLETGCRIGELLTLEWKQVDWERHCLTLPDTKSGSSVTKPLTLRAVEILTNWQQVGHPKPFIYNYKQAARSWNWAKQQVGLGEDKTLVRHTLRHTTATRLIEAGINAPMVKEFLGHKSATTTNRYIHLNVDSLSPLVNVLETMNTKRNIINSTPAAQNGVDKLFR
ncbi:MAG: site-specific integrase [Pseudomonadota bacterium]|nr:site-specific integrase [Pseudomonadota bacterium]